MDTQSSLPPITNYPFQATIDGISGTFHRVIFLPRYFVLPGGQILTENETLIYDQQRVLVQIPEYEVFVPDSDEYQGPIELETPEEASCLVTFDTDFGGRRVERLAVEMPKDTKLEFWPPALKDQIVEPEFAVIAFSKHAVRGAVDGNYDHFKRDIYSILSYEQKKAQFKKSSSKSLRKVAILRSALAAERSKVKKCLHKSKNDDVRIEIPGQEGTSDFPFTASCHKCTRCRCTIL